MNKLVSKNLVKGLPETRLSKDTLCPACEQGKMTRSSHPPRMDTNSKSPLDMIHMDLYCWVQNRIVSEITRLK
ncbi:hypothetical protein OSB04_001930 [Centaurea solstitialis]|uniref:Uncharacterized protein n=1 Tax=Centaurea solstitialis TaxID=347529 RepID=A0AA38TSA9_9ASTR|nr:hypothetical protein OSB04_001930 [Centaurea solstitialis]